MRFSVVVAGVLVLLMSRADAATTFVIYSVQPGETMASVAARCGVSEAELRSLNQTVHEPFARYEVLTVPLSGELAATLEAAEPEGDAPIEEPTVAATANGGAADGVVVGGEAAGTSAGSLLSLETGTAGPVAAMLSNEDWRAIPDASRLDYAVNGAVGRLGQIGATKVRILKERSTGAPAVYVADPGTNLLVTRLYDGWYGIRMLDGSTGWTQVDNVLLTDTELLPAPDAPSGHPAGVRIIQTAYGYLGTPYVWGGTSRNGIDCSGLVLRAFGANGYSLPRTAREQATRGQSVRIEQLQPGDRLYFQATHDYIDHTGMYIGGGKFIHAAGGRGVIITSLFDPFYQRIFVGARR